jgi:hypothetical protein
MKIIYSFLSHVGLGDNIRGLIFLKQVQEQMDFELYIDFNGYPIEKFLLYKTELPKPDVNECFPAMDNEMHHRDLMRFIKHYEYVDCIKITTNWKPSLIISEPIKTYIRDILQLRPEYEEYLNQKLSTLPSHYPLFHYRFGDDHICKKDQLNIQYYNHLMHHKKENMVLISDSLLFKEKCKDIAHVFLNDPIHTTSNPNHKQIRMDELILDTICDFYLIQRATAIYSYSCLPWLSNFVQWTSIIYDIPLYDLR